MALLILLQVCLSIFRKNQSGKKEELVMKDPEADIIATEPIRKETVDTIEEVN